MIIIVIMNEDTIIQFTTDSVLEVLIFLWALEKKQNCQEHIYFQETPRYIGNDRV